jgi:ribosome assembly protein 1
MVSADTLGKVYAVLTRRQAKILSEEMRLGTEVFEVKALVPVTGSFGFAGEIRLR